MVRQKTGKQDCSSCVSVCSTFICWQEEVGHMIYSMQVRVDVLFEGIYECECMKKTWVSKKKVFKGKVFPFIQQNSVFHSTLGIRLEGCLDPDTAHPETARKPHTSSPLHQSPTTQGALPTGRRCRAAWRKICLSLLMSSNIKME